MSFTHRKSICSRLIVVCLFALALSPSHADGPGDDNLLEQAFAGIQAFEDELNFRNPDDSYRAQSESDLDLSYRISPNIAGDLVFVQGLGAASLALGYPATGHGRDAFAAALRFNQLSFSSLDPDLTADLLHTLIGGTVTGDQATLLLNFAWYGSETDDDGNRLPIILPLPPEAGGPAELNGRCTFTLSRVQGEWQVTSFFVVVHPSEFLFEVP